MYKLGIIGYPLSHSISAVIQKAGFESLGIEGSYDVLETSPEDLISRIKYLKPTNNLRNIYLRNLYLKNDEIIVELNCGNRYNIVPAKASMKLNIDLKEQYLEFLNKNNLNLRKGKQLLFFN